MVICLIASFLWGIPKSPFGACTGLDDFIVTATDDFVVTATDDFEAFSLRPVDFAGSIGLYGGGRSVGGALGLAVCGGAAGVLMPLGVVVV